MTTLTRPLWATSTDEPTEEFGAHRHTVQIGAVEVDIMQVFHSDGTLDPVEFFSVVCGPFNQQQAQDLAAALLEAVRRVNRGHRV